MEILSKLSDGTMLVKLDAPNYFRELQSKTFNLLINTFN